MNARVKQNTELTVQADFVALVVSNCQFERKNVVDAPMTPDGEYVPIDALDFGKIVDDLRCVPGTACKNAGRRGSAVLEVPAT